MHIYMQMERLWKEVGRGLRVENVVWYMEHVEEPMAGTRGTTSSYHVGF